MVWCGDRNGRTATERSPRREGPSHAVDLGRLQRFLECHAGQDGREPSRQHRLCPNRGARSAGRCAPPPPPLRAPAWRRPGCGHPRNPRHPHCAPPSGRQGPPGSAQWCGPRIRMLAYLPERPGTEHIDPLDHAASGTFSRGRTSDLQPAARAATAMESAPRTGRRSPSRPSSPTTSDSWSRSGSSCPLATSSPRAIGRSKALPALGRSAGARFTVIRLRGKLNPALTRAALTRSRPSFTAPWGIPTVAKRGQPRR